MQYLIAEGKEERVEHTGSHHFDFVASWEEDIFWLDARGVGACAQPAETKFRSAFTH